MRPWLPPLLIGLLAGVALFYAPLRDRGDDPYAAPAQEGVLPNAFLPGLTWVFEQAPAPSRPTCPPANGTQPPAACPEAAYASDPVVLLAPGRDGPGRGTPGAGTGHEANVSWRTPAVALVQVRHDPSLELAAPWVSGAPPANATPYDPQRDAVQVTFYAVNDAGQVLASNAPDAELARFALSGDFQALPARAWYLGDGAAPPGSFEMPAQAKPLLRPLLPRLAGLTEGAVATHVLEQHPYLWATGPLTLTLRIEQVHPAPAP
ncbi:MAG TPA: hypothetical protein VFH47_04705 [Candidatus Thermoplasmatota archaeon]|nr:hypothetical protein [Candidatus Thermoplasmatota archaeon]